MATLGKWSGGTQTQGNLPEIWTAPNGLFPTQDRNDGSAYSWASATSTITLPSSDLADGYLLIGAYEYEDTSNGRFTPHGKIIQASGTGNFVGGPTGGYCRDTSEDRAYVRTWAFVNNPSASATFQFQWKADADDATGGTARSEFQIIPLYYSNHGIYASTDAGLLGGTTPTVIGSWTTVNESDTAAIERVTNVVSVKGDAKRYLTLGSQFFDERGASRTQRWHGFDIDGVQEDAAKAYSYYRNATNDRNGELFTWMLETVTASITIEQTCYRGDGIGSGQGGADVDGSTPSAGTHAWVVIELNDSAELFRNTGSTNQNIATTGPIDIQASKVADIDFNDAASFTRASDTGMNATVAMDALFGANISAASQIVGSGSRYTGYAEVTINGVENSDSFAGDYLRNAQGSIDTFGWSANLIGFTALAQNEDLGFSVTELTGSEGGGGAINTQVGWVGIWGINLDTLESTGTIFNESIAYTVDLTNTPTEEAVFNKNIIYTVDLIHTATGAITSPGIPASITFSANLNQSEINVGILERSISIDTILDQAQTYPILPTAEYLIRVEKPWTIKPPSGTRLDPSHPLVPYMHTCLILNEGGGSPKNIVLKWGNSNFIHSSYSLTTGAEWGIDKDGMHIHVDGTGSIKSDNSVVAGAFTAPGSVVCRFKHTTDQSSGTYNLFGSHANFALVILVASGDRRVIPKLRSDNASFAVDGSTLNAQNDLVSWGFSYFGSATRIMYKRGAEIFNSTDIQGSTFNTVSMNIGKDDINDGVIGNMYYFYSFDRVLTPAEHKSIYDNPYQIFKPRILWFPMGSPIESGDIEGSISFSIQLDKLIIHTATLERNINFVLDLDLVILKKLVVDRTIAFDFNNTFSVLNKLTKEANSTFDINLSLDILNKLVTGVTTTFNTDVSLTILNRLTSNKDITYNTDLSFNILKQLVTSESTSFDIDLVYNILNQLTTNQNISFNIDLALQILNHLEKIGNVNFNIDTNLSILNQLVVTANTTFNINTSLNILKQLITSGNVNFDINLAYNILNQLSANTSVPFNINLALQLLGSLSQSANISFNTNLDLSILNQLTTNKTIAFNSDLSLDTLNQIISNKNIVFNTNLTLDILNSIARYATITFDINLSLDILNRLIGVKNVNFNTELTLNILKQLVASKNINFDSNLVLSVLNQLTIDQDITFNSNLALSILNQLTVDKNITFDTILTLNILNQLIAKQSVDFDINLALITLSGLPLDASITFGIDLSLDILKQLVTNESINFDIDLTLITLNKLVTNKSINFDINLALSIISGLPIDANISFDVSLGLDILNQLSAVKSINFDSNLSLIALKKLITSANNNFDINTSLNILNQLISDRSINFNTDLALDILKDISISKNISFDIDLAINILNTLSTDKSISFDTDLNLILLNKLTAITNQTFNTEVNISLLNKLNANLNITFTSNLTYSFLGAGAGIIFASISFLANLNQTQTNTLTVSKALDLIMNMSLAQGGQLNTSAVLSLLIQVSDEINAFRGIPENINFNTELDQQHINTANRIAALTFNTALSQLVTTQIDFSVFIEFATILNSVGTLAGAIEVAIAFSTDLNQEQTNIKYTTESIALAIQTDLVTEIHLSAGGDITFNTEMSQDSNIQLLKEVGITFGHLVGMSILGKASLQDAISFGMVNSYEIIGNTLIFGLITTRGRTYKIYIEDRTMIVDEENRIIKIFKVDSTKIT